jgi:hypothetical protein
MARAMTLSPSPPSVPELGPSLSRLTSRFSDAPPLLDLDALRFDLVTELMELASSARDFAESDDRGAAVACVSGKGLQARWEATIETVAERITAVVNGAFDRAATISRYPGRQRAALHLDEVERRAITGRLGAESAPLVMALDALDQAARPASAAGDRGLAGFVAWTDALLLASRRLEGAWLAMEHAAESELASWRVEAEQVEQWRRPLLPVWMATAGVLGLALYLGLAFGGYIPVPAPLRPLALQVWRHL